ncbi:prophage Lp1 protein 43 [Limosilactobacillus coleohominis DSM 14060]|nr:prophage Lp1 protein 43 [Limosilactobacillus coleohominis DSM 14060]
MEDAKVNELLTTVKLDKNVKGNDLDIQLTSFIKQASDMVCLYVGEDNLPAQLEVVVIRITEAHYVQSLNDADGAKTYSEEGASWSFQDNELNPFIPLLERYIDSKRSGSKGGVWTW